MFNVFFSRAQQKFIENENFKVFLKNTRLEKIIFKSDSTRNILKPRDLNPFLKIGLPFKEGNNEDSNPCYFRYDSKIHHVEMIDTIFNHGILKAGVSTFAWASVFAENIIIFYGIDVYDEEWTKGLKHGVKIFDKYANIIYESEDFPGKGINLFPAVINDHGTKLVTIRYDNFITKEDGNLQPLDYYLDFYSVPDWKLICSKQIAKDFSLHVHGEIFWIEYNETDNTNLRNVIGTHYYFYDLDKNKCFKLFLPRSLSFRGSRYEKAWAKDGIYINNISDDPTFIKKSFDRDFIVEEIITK